MARQTTAREVAEATSAAAAKQAAAEARLEAVTERDALLERTEQTLRDTFRSLAAEALSSSNQSLVTLATSTLEKTQEQVKGDLQQRAAIDSRDGPPDRRDAEGRGRPARPTSRRIA